ncbi:hypothetical protein DMB42_52015, partial [Nonomuraea sp. WAC 01424]|uniref:antitoxin n=1 Tax=Nonomuraea sp. WAC 01424 TaxID=2203200 RepID=UPI00100000DD
MSDLLKEADTLWNWVQTHPAPTITVGTVAVLLLVGLAVGLTAFVRRVGAQKATMYVGAGIATGVTATGMWRFFGDVLSMDGLPRFVLFGFIEIAIISCAVSAKKTATRHAARLAETGNTWEKPSTGVDGKAVWALTVLTGVCSAMDARSIAEAVFRLVAPLVAAWLWHRAMASEHEATLARPRSNLAWKVSPERLAVRFGLADPTTRDGNEVAVERVLSRVAKAVYRLRVLEAQEAKAGNAADKHRRKVEKAVEKAGQTVDRRIQEAIEYAGLREPERRQQLLEMVRVTYHGRALTRVELASAWSDWELAETVTERVPVEPDAVPAGGLPALPAEPAPDPEPDL